MKKLVIITLIFITTIALSQEETASLKWLTNLEKAKNIAKKTNKPILVYFTGSDWCEPCKKLKDDFFNSEKFIEKADKMVLVMIDKPFRVDIISEKQMAYNDKIIAKYNSKKRFPKMLILNYKGKVIDEMSGYSFYGELANHYAFINRNI